MGVEPTALSAAELVTSSGDERGETGEAGVSGRGLTPPASTLREGGREGDNMTKRRRRRRRQWERFRVQGSERWREPVRLRVREVIHERNES